MKLYNVIINFLLFFEELFKVSDLRSNISCQFIILLIVQCYATFYIADGAPKSNNIRPKVVTDKHRLSLLRYKLHTSKQTLSYELHGLTCRA